MMQEEYDFSQSVQNFYLKKLKNKTIMSITLNSEQEKFIQTQLESGRFTDAMEVIQTAFHLLEKLNDDYLQWVEETRQKVDLAIAELDRGEGHDGETVVKEILERFKQARQETE
ncbi:ribbon-helix-helix domain-containing protein [Aphanothece hegewaldii]|nr:type II toxin-antitoxin system ParD family antitoxin [Aphanothece hegewaldii]